MKQKDIILIVIVVVITGLATFFLSNLLFASPKSRTTKVEVVEVINPDFQKPDIKYFNTGSLDPTQPISIGDNQNPKPFNNSTNNGQ